MTTPIFRTLDEAKISETLERLRNRIGERFPGSGLRDVAEELISIGKEVSECVACIRAPNWPIRIVVGLTIAAMTPVLLALGNLVRIPDQPGNLSEIIQVTQAGIQNVVFFGVAVLFLGGIESRLKRKRALAMISQRSLAHVVDMHQLTKDPERLLSAEPSAFVAREVDDAAGAGRYLDYCSELLSVTTKLAALLVQYFDDRVVLGAVNEIETPATGLSGKIWQKIRLLDTAPLV
jgi:hypothetical protein